MMKPEVLADIVFARSLVHEQIHRPDKAVGWSHPYDAPQASTAGTITDIG